MDKTESKLTPEEQAAVDELKKEIDLFAFINYLERHNEPKEKLYSAEEYTKFLTNAKKTRKKHEDSELLKTLNEQVECLYGDAEYDFGHTFYNGQEAIDADTLVKIARLQYYTIIEMQRCGYSPDEIENITYYWPY